MPLDQSAVKAVLSFCVIFSLVLYFNLMMYSECFGEPTLNWGMVRFGTSIFLFTPPPQCSMSKRVLQALLSVDVV